MLVVCLLCNQSTTHPSPTPPRLSIAAPWTYIAICHMMCNDHHHDHHHYGHHVCNNFDQYHHDVTSELGGFLVGSTNIKMTHNTYFSPTPPMLVTIQPDVMSEVGVGRSASGTQILPTGSGTAQLIIFSDHSH